MSYSKVVIIGAARSGTNMLRDILSDLPEINTWPCDEINYIWRYKNREVPHDEFTVDNINKENKRYINKQFDKLQTKKNSRLILEKTCANSFRVSFVDEILDGDIKYINIYRDPVDVVASARKRWKAKLDIKYTLEKARYVPIRDFVYYATKYLKNRLDKIFNEGDQLTYWGPKMKEVEFTNKNKDLISISSNQWKTSIENSMSFFKENADKVINIKYEKFVSDPFNELKKIIEFLNLSYSDEQLKKATDNVFAKSVGKGYSILTDTEITKVKTITDLSYEKMESFFEETTN